jgi:hypothetical protein
MDDAIKECPLLSQKKEKKKNVLFFNLNGSHVNAEDYEVIP